MKRASQWTGYLVSVFSIILAIVDGFARDLKTATPGWMYGIMGICILLAGSLGVVCLVTAFIGFLKNRKPEMTKDSVETGASA